MRRSKNSLTVQRGLLTKHEVHVQKSRVQTIYLREDWLDKVLGRLNLVYEQIAHLPYLMDNNKLVVPSVYLCETNRLINEVFALGEISALTFTPSSRAYFYKVAILWSIIYGVVATVIVLVRPDLSLHATFVTVLWVVHIYFLHMAWKRRGLAIQGDLIVVRTGVIGTDYVVFPANKIQEVSLIQSPFMRRRHSATIVFTTASRSAKVPHINQDIARAAMDYGLYCVESSSRSWM